LDSDGFNRLNGLIRCGFHEILGFAEQPPVLPKALNPNSEPRTPNSEPSFSSLGAHAPHTTSPALLKWAKAWSTAQGLPLSIHVAESWEEEEFLLTGQGPWRDFLEERGKWSDHWTAPKLGPVAYLNSLGILDNNTQCIHLTRADLNDLAILKNKKARPVICPRSNRFISGSLPPLPQMVQWGLDPALGTDSLASNRDLNLWKEMAFVHRSFPQIDPEMILQMATLNGARSIGLNHKLGSLAQGKDAAMLFLPLDIQASKDLPEGILASKGEKMQWIDDKKN
jgi:cytosine/adenosine deaminase-related metal-dependent hydrolase